MTPKSMALHAELRFRKRFPQIKTTTYQSSFSKFHLCIEDEIDNFEELNELFKTSIINVFQSMNLTMDKPENGTVVKSINPDDCSYYELIELSFKAQQVIFAGLFPDAPKLKGYKVVEGEGLQFLLSEEASELLTSELLKTLKKLNNEEDIELFVEGTGFVTEDHGFDRHLFTLPISIRDVPEYIQKEEYEWFQDFERVIRNGESKTRHHLQSAGYSCVVEATATALDLRQLVICYDTVFLTLPKIDDNGFWEKQKISKDDFLYLVQEDRVRIISTMPEETIDMGLIAAAHNLNPNGVLGCRKTNEVILLDAVHTAKHYLFSDQNLQNELHVFAERISSTFNAPLSVVYDTLSFPNKLRDGLQRSLITGGNNLIGWSGIGKIFSEYIKSATGKNLMLEAGYWGNNVHLAHAFRSTFVPDLLDKDHTRSWLGTMSMMGAQLNMYRNLNDKYAASWAVNERRIHEKQQEVLPPINMFDFKDGVKIEQIVTATSSGRDRRKGRALINRLANLSNDDRREEIKLIQNEMNEFYSRKNRSILKYGAGSSLGVLSYFSGAPMFIAKPFIDYAIDLAKKSPSLDRVIEVLEKELIPDRMKNEDLDFLSKLERVAWISNDPKDL